MEPNFVEITDPNDDLLLPWLDLFETTFPPNEKVLVSTFLGQLKYRARGMEEHWHMLAALDESGKFIGLVNYDFCSDFRAALLWYLAAIPEVRNQGIGSKCYQELVRRSKEWGARAIVFEVELPEHSDDADLARRRIGFYKRQGARLLTGIHYLQTVGSHQPLTPMNIMVHPLEPMTPPEAFDIAKALFGELLTQTGELAFE